jgi:hypothetical protein
MKMDIQSAIFLTATSVIFIIMALIAFSVYQYQETDREAIRAGLTQELLPGSLILRWTKR